MKSWLNQSIVKFIIPISGIAFFFIWSYSSFILNHYQDESIIEINTSSKMLSSIINRPLIDRDYTTLANILEEIPSNDKIASIRVINSSGENLAERNFPLTKQKNISERVSYLLYGNETITGSSSISSGGFLEVDMYYYKDAAKVIREISILSLSSVFLLLSTIVLSAIRGKILKNFSANIRKAVVAFESGKQTNQRYKEFDLMVSEVSKLIKKRLSSSNSESIKLKENLQSKEEQIAKLEEEKLKLSSNLKAQRQLIASIGHDLRSPLNVISSTSRILLRSNLTESQYEQVSRINRACIETSSLADNIMNTGLFDNDGDKEEVIDLIDFFEKSIVTARSQVDAEKLNIFLIPDRGLSNSIISSPSRIRRIISNLLNNAIKFTDEGSISVYIETKIDGEQSFLTVRVSDEGKGISDENINHIFKDNFSDDDSSSARGIGLGLYICKEFVSKMGGSIGATSIEGSGSTFWFEIPIEIKSKTSIEQDKLINSSSSQNLCLGILSNNAEYADSITRISGLLGQEMSYFTDLDKVEGNIDILFVPGLVESSSEKIENLRRKCKYLVSIENDEEKTSENLSKIDLILKRNTSSYSKLTKTFQFIHRTKMPSIGVKRVMDDSSSAIQNPIMDRLNIQTTGRIDGYKILLVDDHKDSRLTMKELLETEGASILDCGTLEEAVSLLSTRKFDLVITDYFLEEATGKDIALAARESKLNSSSHVICCTGDTSISQDKESLETFNTMIVKPIDENRLLTIIAGVSKSKVTLNLV